MSKADEIKIPIVNLIPSDEKECHTDDFACVCGPDTSFNDGRVIVRHRVMYNVKLTRKKL